MLFYFLVIFFSKMFHMVVKKNALESVFFGSMQLHALTMKILFDLRCSFRFYVSGDFKYRNTVFF